MKNLLKSVSLILVAAAVGGDASGQTRKPAPKPAAAAVILATAGKLSFTTDSLSDEGKKLYEERHSVIANARTTLLGEMAGDLLLELESSAKGTTPSRLIADVRAKVADPPAADIKAVLDANEDKLAAVSPDEARRQVVAFLRRDAEQKAVNDYLDGLRSRYKFALGKDVKAAGLKPADVLLTAGGRSITVQDFESKYRVELNDAEFEIYEDLVADLESSILSALVAEEAKLQGIDATDYMAREITDKQREFTDRERYDLETALRSRLFAKYPVKILLKPPTPIVQSISVDDDPATGPAAAAVTVVMFSDFQCPTCARTHPVLKQVIGEFPGKVKLVVRDFPLEAIHADAFNAARAANAARAQGKYFEFIDVLYRNQEALDLDSLKRYAAEVGLNVQKFEIDFNAENNADEIRKDLADGDSYGVGGTPTIFVNGVKVRRLSAEAFRQAIKDALAQKPAAPRAAATR
ncbi:MAG: thioredoxin domain-containing protein [Pyrinomonadaceae bacterium]